MKNLSSLQLDFFLTCKPGGELTQGFSSYFSTPSSVLSKRLDIYRQSILLSLQRALHLTYPACVFWMSPCIFDQLSMAFLREHLPTETDLNRFGADFPFFLEKMQHTYSIPPFLSELAEFEWAWHDSLFRGNNLVTSKEVWQQKITKAGDHIIFMPPVDGKWIISPYPLYDLWQQKNEAENVKTRYYFFIWQKEGLRTVEVFDQESYLFLESLSLEKTWLCVCETLDDKINSEHVPALLADLVSRGCIRML